MEGKRDKKPKDKGIRRIVALCVVGVLLIGAAVAAGPLYRIFYSQQSAFAATPTPAATPTAEPAATPEPEDTQEATPTPAATPDPLELMESIADTGTMKNIVNVLLVGVDYAEERAAWDKNFYCDVMLVLAVNFDDKTVDMISIPRDTYAKIANKEGIYKLNSSIYHGGGVPEGFPNVCESVSWVLGGIPIDYYVGVTMPTVKVLGDAIGGVDYDVEMDFKIQGRQYSKGMQHLDGQGILDYCRVRKHIEQSGDANRVNRQKKMLIALYEKVRDNQSILEIPSLAMQMSDQVYTNLSFEQLAALAVFGYHLDSESIQMHSMAGTMKMIFNWAFSITNQQKRVDLIREVYGVEVEKELLYASPYVDWLWAKMQGEGDLEKIQKILDKDAALEVPLLMPETVQTLQDSMAQWTAAAEPQEDKKPQNKEYEEMEAIRVPMEELAKEAFSAAGYKVSWNIPENPGEPEMTG